MAGDTDVDDAQERHVTHIIADLTAEFPNAPHEAVARLVRQVHDRYDTASVRSFVPILVAKDVRALLRDNVWLPDASEVPAQAGSVSRAASSFELAAGPRT